MKDSQLVGQEALLLEFIDLLVEATELSPVERIRLIADALRRFRANAQASEE